MNSFALFSVNPFIYFAGLIILAIIAAAIIDHGDQEQIKREHEIAAILGKYFKDDIEREIALRKAEGEWWDSEDPKK